VRGATLGLLAAAWALGRPAAAAPGLAGLTQPRCWASPPGRVACPNYNDVWGAKDAGWLSLALASADPRDDLTTVIVHVGANYAGEVAFEPETGVAATWSLLRAARFWPAPPPRPIAIGPWLAGTPRVRLDQRDRVQLDVRLQLDCGEGRVGEAPFDMSGERFWIQRFPGQPFVALLTMLTQGDAAFGIREVRSQIVDVREACAARE
jgi:hypothetical protein